MISGAGRIGAQQDHACDGNSLPIEMLHNVANPFCPADARMGVTNPTRNRSSAATVCGGAR